jgi:heat shock protein HtpX
MTIEDIRAHKSTNSFHSLLLVLIMTAILALIGWAMFGNWGLVIAVGLAVFGVVFSPRVAPRLVLRLYKARPISPSQSPELTEMFFSLCRRANLDPLPELYYVPSKMPNAFAVGHDDSAAIAVTDGLLRTMNSRELEGILAHEISHLRHLDTHVMGLADSIARITAMLSRIGLMMMLFSFAMENTWWFLLRGLLLFMAPAITALLQLALSRSREFNADMGAVELTHDPYGLASALDKLERLAQPPSIWRKILVPGQKQVQPALLRTHPETEERIRRLLALAQRLELPAAPPVRPSRLAPPVRMQSPLRRVPIGFDERVRKKPKYHIMSGIYR